MMGLGQSNQQKTPCWEGWNVEPQAGGAEGLPLPRPLMCNTVAPRDKSKVSNTEPASQVDPDAEVCLILRLGSGVGLLF